MTTDDPASAGGGTYPRTTESNDTHSHIQDPSYLDQQVLDSLLGLASGQPEGSSFGGGNPPPWAETGATGSGTAYPGLNAETSGHIWSGHMASTDSISHENNVAWLGNDISYEPEDPARELSNLQWPLPGPVSRPSDNINWSEAIDQQEFPGRRSLPRRRSRYRYMQSEQRAVPIPISASPSSPQESGPLQRWKDSPPQDEPATMSAIFDAIRSPRAHLEGPTECSQPAYSRVHSGTSADSGGSSSSMQSAGSAWSGISEASRGRRAGFGPLGRVRQGRVGKKRISAVTKDSRPFKCTFCCDSFKTKYDWARHEKSRHLNLESWVCAPRGGSAVSTVTGRPHCAYCSAIDPSDEHLDEHNHSTCHDRPIEARSFGRKDHLVQHLRVMHKLEKLPRFDDWKVQSAEITSRCGFCDTPLPTWSKRTDHLAGHFRKGMTMRDWKGEHGFTPEVAKEVVHGLPPYLIGSESLSVVPFSATKQGTKDHFAQILSRTHGYEEAHSSTTDLETSTPLPSPSVLSSRAATSKAFTEILERHLKHFSDEQIAQGLVLTDEMLRQESRRVIYDSDDGWNTSCADDGFWLAQFRSRYGLDERNDGQDKNTQEN
ncbi:benzoate 4-monooxygenase cytochrome p450 [Colletotrichum karsti]|uniref:Benzoate 4-monooxygenase cytochrome p450 n=1 Tax=Colletotrichum karsti TaxID=1095194 RepID=A0A9P6I6S7_9PEZI|nr:benzoate 4-monooxygenase cytochrome p450 [Colletotrichum karsti]KAF9878333.1 benzoate 4-monooxygenase cytochrome p450 [Colletotrichum karsti]